MSTFSTVYDVKVRYSMDNRDARRGTSGLRDDTKALGVEAKRTTSELAQMGRAVVAAVGVRAAGGALLGFNATVQDTKLQIAGMMALARKTDLADNISRADRLFLNLQRRAAVLPGTTMEYARMAGLITQPITDAGLGLKDLEDLTVNAVVGAKALGVEWQVAARDIDQALRGQFHVVDVFTGKLLGSIGFKGEEGRKRFNEMSADKRAAELKRALTQKQIDQLALAQGQTFRGVLSTLQDSFQQTAGKVGLPLFRQITIEVKAWNQWLDKNRRLVDEMAAKVGKGLVTGFAFIKDVLQFMVSNSGTLIAIGKIWLATKIGGMIASGTRGGRGLFEAGAGAIAFGRGQRDRFNPETGEYEHTPAGRGRKKLTRAGLMEGLPLVGQAAAVGFAFGTIINEATGLSEKLATLALDKTSLQFEKVTRAADSLTASLQRAADANKQGVPAMTNLQGARMDLQQQANVVRDMLKAQEQMIANPANIDAMNRFKSKRSAVEAMGLDESDFAKFGGAKGFADAMSKRAGELSGKETALGVAGFVAFQAGLTQLTDFQRQTLDTAKAQQDLLAFINQSLTKGVVINPQTVLEILRNATDDPHGKHKKLAEKPKVNVTIQRIEVQSDDPDRMAFGLIESFRDAAKNPSSALRALREG